MIQASQSGFLGARGDEPRSEFPKGRDRPFGLAQQPCCSRVRAFLPYGASHALAKETHPLPI
jgi:hypothetical protein